MLEVLQERALSMGCENNFYYNQEWDKAIKGITVRKGKFYIVYSKEEILLSIMEKNNCNYEDAYDDFEYNLSYIENQPGRENPLIIDETDYIN